VGITLCPKHGRQGGPLCCRHIIDATIRDPAKPASPLSVVHFKIDVLDDGTELSTCAICASCASEWGIAAGTILPGEYMEEGRLPWIAPTCNRCFAEFLKKLEPVE